MKENAVILLLFILIVVGYTVLIHEIVSCYFYCKEKRIEKLKKRESDLIDYDNLPKYLKM